MSSILSCSMGNLYCQFPDPGPPLLSKCVCVCGGQVTLTGPLAVTWLFMLSSGGWGEWGPWQPEQWTTRGIVLDTHQAGVLFLLLTQEDRSQTLSTNTYFLKLDGTLGLKFGRRNVNGSGWPFGASPTTSSHRSLYNFSHPHLPTGFGT